MAATVHTNHVQSAPSSSRTRPMSTPNPIPHHPHANGLATTQLSSRVQNNARKQNNFGPYLLLQTLGEGEFGKVKLGMHTETGQEVAIKLIRKESVDTSSRLNKVEREISVLRSVRHPNIVKLFDVIETEKYIGIIIEYASGGELFDHILAHRYLKERDAQKLFAQLISGVNYLHQKSIVHRDLKLENLLLDRNRNIIITDFGFANQFGSANSDLMATSCGSPCYAAPELVISEGLYVGSAVDIWSCGVILYAMLCGYLPFDDDPMNPDGDNINLLYKYILNTPLVFPDWVGPDARDLLRSMLVPDPKNRTSMQGVMKHRWLSQYSSLFEQTLEQLEAAASLPSRQTTQHPAVSHYLSIHGPQPTMTEGQKRHTISVEYDMDGSTVNGDTGSFMESLTEAEYDPDTEHSDYYEDNRSIEVGSVPDDYIMRDRDRDHELEERENDRVVPDISNEFGAEKWSDAMVGDREELVTMSKQIEQGDTELEKNVSRPMSMSSLKDSSGVNGIETPPATPRMSDNTLAEVPTDSMFGATEATGSQQRPNSREVPSNIRQTPISAVAALQQQQPVSILSRSVNGVPSAPKPRETRRDSLPSAFPESTPESVPVHTSTKVKFGNEDKINGTMVSEAPVPHLEMLMADMTNMANSESSGTPETMSVMDENNTGEMRKSISERANQRGPRRKAMSLLVGSSNSDESLYTIRNKQQGQNDQQPQSDTYMHLQQDLAGTHFSAISSEKEKSKSAGKKVMDWFRKRSQNAPREVSPIPDITKLPAPAVIPNRAVAPAVDRPLPPPNKATPSPTPSKSVAPTSNKTKAPPPSKPQVQDYNDSKLRVHHGAVDQSALTSRLPSEVFMEVKETLAGMGIDVKRDGDFKLKCVRKKRKVKTGKDGAPSTPAEEREAEAKKRKMSSGAPFKLLLRRTSNYNQHGMAHPGGNALTSHQNNSISSVSGDDEGAHHLTRAFGAHKKIETAYGETVYGDPSEDPCDEIRFSVELCKIKNLPNLYIVDIRRMKGNVWSYKFVYNIMLERLDLTGKGGYIPTMSSISNMQKVTKEGGSGQAAMKGRV